MSPESSDSSVAQHKANIASLDPKATKEQVKSFTIDAAKGSYATSAMYPLACMFPKLSICCLYLRVFTKGKARIITLGTSAFLVSNGIAFFVAQIVLCHPPSYYWEIHTFAIPNTPAAKKNCINLSAIAIAINPPHIVSDIVMMVLPLPTVWRLHISRANKVGLTIAFLAGSMSVHPSSDQGNVANFRAS